VIAKGSHFLLCSTNDLYGSGISEDVNSIRTYYENKWLDIGKKICYIKFKLTA